MLNLGIISQIIGNNIICDILFKGGFMKVGIPKGLMYCKYHPFLVTFFSELGAEIIKVESEAVVATILDQVAERKITTVCIGRPKLSFWRAIVGINLFNTLLKKLSFGNIDLIILS